MQVIPHRQANIQENSRKETSASLSSGFLIGVFKSLIEAFTWIFFLNNECNGRSLMFTVI